MTLSLFPFPYCSYVTGALGAGLDILSIYGFMAGGPVVSGVALGLSIANNAITWRICDQATDAAVSTTVGVASEVFGNGAEVLVKRLPGVSTGLALTSITLDVYNLQYNIDTVVYNALDL